MLFLQAADPKLTLDRVATAPVLVAELARSTGRRLEVSPALNKEVLMVCADGVGTADVLAKLALAATATWQPIEGGLRLVPDNAARALEASRERARRLQAIADGIRKKANAAKAKPGPDPGDAVAGMFIGGSSAVDAFVPMLDLGALAAMEDGDRIVFATNPTAAQRPLRGNPTPLVADWIAKHNRQAKAMAGSAGEMPEGMEAMLKGPLGDRYRKMTRTIQAAPAKIVVVASKGALGMFGGEGLDVRLEVRAYGADGAVLLEETGNLDTDVLAIVAAMQAKKPEPAPAATTPIVYSEEAKALAGSATVQALQTGMGLGERSAMPPKLRALLLAPEKRDPLSLVPGEGLAALAKARRRPLVACLPDSAFASILGSPAPKTVEEVEADLKTGPMRLVPDDAFLVVKAADPARARRDRIDRAALGTLLRTTTDHDSPTLDEISAYAARSPEPARNALSMTLLGLFVPSSMGSMAGMVDWNSLRLYASLSPAQRSSLASGARVPFSTLSAEGKSALTAMLYGASGRLNVDRGGVAPEDDVISMSIRMWAGGAGIDAREEPTEAAPRGLPAGGYLQASVTTDAIIRPVTADGASPSAMGPDELAMLRLLSTTMPVGENGLALKLPEAGRLGTRTVWNLRGYVAPETYVTSTLRDDRTPKDGRIVGMNDLPADMQTRIAQRTEKLKKSPMGAILAMSGAMGTPAVKP